jgi:hypothetical protein
VIRFTVGPHYYVAADPCPHWLRLLLRDVDRTFEAGGPLGYREVEELVSWELRDQYKRTCFLGGLLPRVLRMCWERGVAVQFEDCREPCPRLQVEEAVLDGCLPTDRELLEAALCSPLGQVEVGNQEAELATCLLLGRLWPEARVVVALPTLATARDWWEELERRLGVRVGLAMAGARRKGGRWLVSTYVNAPGMEWDEWDILLLPGGERVASQRGIFLWRKMRFKRVYALVRPQRRLDARGEWLLETLAGPVIRRLGPERVPVRVALLRTPAGALGVVAGATALERKRRLYWHNRARNRFIAGVAEAVYRGRRPALKKVGFGDEDLRRLSGPRGNGAVVVLVEGPEHAWRLRDLIPEYVDGPFVRTTAEADRVGIRADVLIRATGTGWPLHVRGFPHRAESGRRDLALLVDLVDTFHPLAQADTCKRIQAYERQGLTVGAAE